MRKKILGKMYSLAVIANVFLFLGCAHQKPNGYRVPNNDAQFSEKVTCEQNINKMKENVISFVNNHPFVGKEKLKILNKSNRAINFECVEERSLKNPYVIYKADNKILIESDLVSMGGYFDSEEAQAQVKKLDIELRAITFDRLMSAIIFSAIYDFTFGKSNTNSVFFEYLKLSQEKN